MDKLFGWGEGMSLSIFLVRMGCSLVLGGFIAWRPLSRLVGGVAPKQSLTHALFLMTLASTLVIMVIGDSLARAFGIVGLGSFIRFRTALKDPREVVMFFVAIGMGMACGLGQLAIAGLGVLIMSIVLAPLDRAAAQRLPEAPAEKAPAREEVRVG